MEKRKPKGGRQNWIMRVVFILSVFFLFAFTACNTSDDYDDCCEDEWDEAPYIRDIQIYSTSGDRIYPGDYLTFDVSVNDREMDITSLYYTEYYPDYSSDPYSGPHVVTLSTQPYPSTIYTIEDAMRVEGPPGSRRLEFRVADYQGHESDYFIVYFEVLP